MSDRKPPLDLSPELNPALKFRSFDHRQSLESGLCTHICDRLRRGIEQRGEAVLVVSGGRTPVALFQSLSQQPLDWSRVQITLADERWVPADHADANERMVRQHLLQNRAAAARFVSLLNSAVTPHEGQVDVEQRLQVLPELIDLGILGMGEDGHTASFFPHAEELAQALAPEPPAWCAAVTPPQAPWPRMTLTLPRLLASRELVLHLYGEFKLPVLQAALSEGTLEAMPVRALLRQSKTPVSIWWAP